MLVLIYSKLNSKKSTRKIINKLFLQISRIKQVSYNIYRFVIKECLLSFLIKIFEENFVLSPKEIKLVILIIDHIYNCNYY